MFGTTDPVVDYSRALADMVKRFQALPADVRAFVAADDDLPA